MGMAFLAWTVLTWGQVPPTLDEYLKGIGNEPITDRPSLVLEPERVKPHAGATGLAAYDRKWVSVGGLRAIVPTTMVVVDDGLKREPNLYDGLPREEKVLYLMTTLDDGQWDRITKEGIGLADLRKDQQAVFASLLPQPFRWRDAHGTEDTHIALGPLVTELKPNQAQGVRLRLSRSVTYMLRDPKHPSSVTPVEPTGLRMLPGTHQLFRDPIEEEVHPNETFGVSLRREIPNTSKVSQLPYASKAFDAPVNLPARVTVGELLKTMSGQMGTEIVADLRVAGRSVSFTGTQVRAGDLLQALALAVTGTYRRVGSMYALTSDLTGAGSRKLRIASEIAALRGEIRRRHRAWQAQVRKAGTIRRVGLDAKDPLAPPQAAWNKLDQPPKPGEEPHPPRFNVTPALRKMFASVMGETAVSDVDFSRSWMQSNVRYGFVLPDGRSLQPEMNAVGSTFDFLLEPLGGAPRNASFADLPLRLASSGSGRALIVRAKDPATAERAVDLARSHGFGTLWIETASPVVLKACLNRASKAKLSVGLALRPWLATGAPAGSDLDRNLLGETGAAFQKRKTASMDWQEFFAERGWTDHPFEDAYAPGDSRVTSRWAGLVSLARMPGLAGVAVLDAQPSGYGAKRTFPGGFQTLDGNEIATGEFGYSTVQRVEFLQSHGMDPIDLAPTNTVVALDLSQPFFLDRGLFPHNDLPEGVTLDAGAAEAEKAWDEWRERRNREAVEGLLASLGSATNAPILVVPHRAAVDQDLFDLRVLVRFVPGSPVPAYPLNGYEQDVVDSTVTTLVTLTDTNLEAAIAQTHESLTKGLKSATRPLAVDVRFIPEERLGTVLDAWFARTDDRKPA